jgi:hypothetical protein
MVGTFGMQIEGPIGFPGVIIIGVFGIVIHPNDGGLTIGVSKS